MRLVNLTPHPVVLRPGAEATLPPSGQVARIIPAETREIGRLPVHGAWIPVVAEAGERRVEGLPAPEEGALFVVSRAVAEAVRDRDDLVVPDDLIRDPGGAIVAAGRLATVAGRLPGWVAEAARPRPYAGAGGDTGYHAPRGVVGGAAAVSPHADEAAREGWGYRRR